MKKTIYIQGPIAKEIDLRPLCPKCDECVVGYDTDFIPRSCPKCGYDLLRPIWPIRKFFHSLFWGNGIDKYPLAQFDLEAAKKRAEAREFKEFIKVMLNDIDAMQRSCVVVEHITAFRSGRELARTEKKTGKRKTRKKKK